MSEHEYNVGCDISSLDDGYGFLDDDVIEEDDVDEEHMPRQIRYERSKARKEELVEIAGGKCVKCGYGAYLGALDFHHRDKEMKSFTISLACREFNKYLFDKLIKIEIQKCDLLCSNCHREEHWG